MKVVIIIIRFRQGHDLAVKKCVLSLSLSQILIKIPGRTACLPQKQFSIELQFSKHLKSTLPFLSGNHNWFCLMLCFPSHPIPYLQRFPSIIIIPRSSLPPPLLLSYYKSHFLFVLSCSLIPRKRLPNHIEKGTTPSA